MRTDFLLAVGFCATLIVLHSPVCTAVFGKYTMGDSGMELRRTSVLNTEGGTREHNGDAFDASRELTMERLENFLRKKRQGQLLRCYCSFI